MTNEKSSPERSENEDLRFTGDIHSDEYYRDCIAEAAEKCVIALRKVLNSRGKELHEIALDQREAQQCIEHYDLCGDELYYYYPDAH